MSKTYSQDPIFTQFYNVPEYLNPSFTGGGEGSQIGIINRSQWFGLNYGLNSQFFYFDSFLENINSGIGISILNHHESITRYNFTQVNLNYAYHVQLSDGWYFFPSISAGFGIKDYAFDATPNTAIVAGETGSGPVGVNDLEEFVNVFNFSNALRIETSENYQNAELSLVSISGKQLVNQQIPDKKFWDIKDLESLIKFQKARVKLICETTNEILKKLDKDKKVKVIILEGAGKGFSAGHNLKEVKDLKKKERYKKLFNLCSKLMLQIVEGKKPVIAKVHGAAYAAGCQLVASCDLAYSTNDALFATPGVNIGLFCSTPMVAVSRKINRKPMMKMLLTGEPINANYAKEIGLINDYFSKSKLNSETMKIAKKIASKSNLTIKIGKQAFYKQLEMPLRKAYSYTSQMMTYNMMAMDAKEGISAFLEKRKPKWRNK